MKSLHLVREQEPEDKLEYHIERTWCFHCMAWIWIIHLNLPPEDPQEGDSG